MIERLSPEDQRINIDIHYLKSSKQLIITNQSNQAIKAQYLEIELETSNYQFTHFFSNGFQTWTESKWFSINETISKLRWYSQAIWKYFNMKAYGDYDGIQYQKLGLHSFHHTCLKNENTYQFMASINEQNGFTIFLYRNNRFTIVKELSKTNRSPLLQIYFSEGSELPKLYQEYFNTINQDIDSSPEISGWTSWYNYYTKIDEDIIVNNLQHFIDNDIPIDVFQIDDGWQKAVGDWHLNNKFPGGLKPIVDHAHDSGIKAGLWMAPFICEKDSDVFRNHPDWIRKDHSSKEAVAGRSLDWSGEFYVLEWRSQEVQNYLIGFFNQILHTWGFDLMKLDFLYAVTIGLKEQNKGQEMYEAMLWLREIFGEKEILACGVPLASCYGLVEYCRVSSDVALQWEDKLLAHFVGYRERVSTLNALRTTISRSFLNRYTFNNDPDVYILRTENNKLSASQKYSLYLINQTLGGLLFSSDDISNYDSEQWNLYLKQFPVRQKQIIEADIIEDHGWVMFSNRELTYLLSYNLSPQNRFISLPTGEWVYNQGIIENQLSLKAFSSEVFLLRSKSQTQLLYSDGHLFSGMEIDQLNIDDNKIDFLVNEKCRLVDMNFIFEVDDPAKSYWVNDTKLEISTWSGKTIVKYKLQNKS